MDVSDYLLTFLSVAKKEKRKVTPIKLQKVFFILEKEKGVNLGLDFKPNTFGPYSEKLQNKLYELAKNGLVIIKYHEVRNKRHELVGYAESYKIAQDLENNADNEIIKFFRRWTRKNPNEIMDYVERKYPEYFDTSSNPIGVYVYKLYKLSNALSKHKARNRSSDGNGL